MKKLICFVFGHKYVMQRKITREISELNCERCKREFAIHTGVQTLLPLDDDLRECNNDLLRMREQRKQYITDIMNEIE